MSIQNRFHIPLDMIEYNISQCLVHGKLDIVLQGPYSDYALDTAYQYLDLNFVNEVIISCWEDDIVPEDPDQDIASPMVGP